MKTRRPAALTTCLLMTIAATTTAANGRQPARSAETIPFRTAGNTLVAVEGAIGPLDGLTLLLDTGTHVSVVDSTVARRLNPHRTADRIDAFGRLLSTGRLTVPFVRLGPIHAPDLPVLHRGPSPARAAPRRATRRDRRPRRAARTLFRHRLPRTDVDVQLRPRPRTCRCLRSALGAPAHRCHG